MSAILSSERYPYPAPKGETDPATRIAAALEAIADDLARIAQQLASIERSLRKETDG